MADDSEHKENEGYKINPVRRRRPGLSTLGKFGVATALGAVLVVFLYAMLVKSDSIKVQTSNSQEFQEPDNGSTIGLIDESGEPDFAPSEFDTSELDAKNAKLAAQVEQLKDELAKAKNAVNPETAEQLDRLSKQLDAMAQSSSEQQKTIAALQQQLQDRQADSLEAQRRAQEEARRQAEYEQRRALMEKQIASDGVIFDNGKSGSGSGNSTGDGSASNGYAPANYSQSGYVSAPSRNDRQRQFLENGAEPVKTELASVIANPSHTVLQGTMIAASLLNAVNSDMTGAVTAVVNSSVYSFDGTQILIPSGSKAFGQYSSDISLGQKRIQIVWTRIVTPEGQAVSISSIGGDQLGRAGVTGDVNSHFFQRFGGAALVSLISAGPEVAAAALSDSNEIASDTLSDTGDDLANATEDVMSDYIKIPATITVDQGATVSIVLDRDVEIF